LAPLRKLTFTYADRSALGGEAAGIQPLTCIGCSNMTERPWLIRGSGSIQNAGEFKIWFLKFDAYFAPQEKNTGAATMTIFEGLLLVLTIAGMTAVYEWRQDFLYGPCLRPDDRLDVR
jgi:hypothetical protein